MNPNPCRFGFRVVGPTTEPRRLVDHAAAFRAHAECDSRAETHRECYLSAFQFGEDFADWLNANDSPKGYAGACWSPWLWLDIDREELDHATRDARRLAAFAVDRWRLDGDELLLFFSGSKGFHIGLPLSRCGILEPSTTFNGQCRRLAERLATEAGTHIDDGVFDRVRLFRAPNSWHPRTGRRKRRLSFDELLNVRTEAIVERAAEPLPFELPDPPHPHPQAVADWRDAGEEIVRRAADLTERRTTANGAGRLNRSTLAFIREGATVGDRARTLYAAARNLADHGCPQELAHELLTEAALDSGLPPSETRRQIDCGWNDSRKDSPR